MGGGHLFGHRRRDKKQKTQGAWGGWGFLAFLSQGGLVSWPSIALVAPCAFLVGGLLFPPPTDRLQVFSPFFCVSFIFFLSADWKALFWSLSLLVGRLATGRRAESNHMLLSSRGKKGSHRDRSPCRTDTAIKQTDFSLDRVKKSRQWRTQAERTRIFEIDHARGTCLCAEAHTATHLFLLFFVPPPPVGVVPRGGCRWHTPVRPATSREKARSRSRRPDPRFLLCCFLSLCFLFVAPSQARPSSSLPFCFFGKKKEGDSARSPHAFLPSDITRLPLPRC